MRLYLQVRQNRDHLIGIIRMVRMICRFMNHGEYKALLQLGWVRFSTYLPTQAQKRLSFCLKPL